ncbi:MAG: Gfo/Idh/MocA family oxidoreductase [Caldilineaceae bacterium]|nr:Gfo/Idh/MocA family oxidoreductase [Caldilineaceae bacterium]
MTSSRPVPVGLIGCGNISGTYMQVLEKLDAVQVVACADMLPDAAQKLAERFQIPRACTVEALLADPAIEIVLNLTTPNAHGAIALAALEAGKSVYNEKPLALSRDEALQLLQLAARRGLRVGAAPDTFLGGGLQTCRSLIDEGAIGMPVAATAFMMSRGHEHWHPNPAFYYQRGGGPMFDMGPYYLTALVSLLGPVRRVTGSARISRPERTITSQPRYGQTIRVEVPTHVVGVLDFVAGAIGVIVTTFDVQASALPFIEIYGTSGTLSVPDPNTFGGPIRLRAAGASEWQDIPISRPHTTQSRGIGLADMATGLYTGAPHRANGDLAYHVLDMMLAIHEASEDGRHIALQSTCERPPLLSA